MPAAYSDTNLNTNLKISLATNSVQAVLNTNLNTVFQPPVPQFTSLGSLVILYNIELGTNSVLGVLDTNLNAVFQPPVPQFTSLGNLVTLYNIELGTNSVQAVLPKRFPKIALLPQQIQQFVD